MVARGKLVWYTTVYMGLTFIKAIVKNPQHPQKLIEEEFLVDSGATYSVVPHEKLEKIGVKPLSVMSFTLADGTKTTRHVGEATFEFEGIKRTSPVIFGKKGDSALFGVMTLESLGLMLDPFQRKLRPMKLFLAKRICITNPF